MQDIFSLEILGHDRAAHFLAQASQERLARQAANALPWSVPVQVRRVTRRLLRAGRVRDPSRVRAARTPGKTVGV